MSTTRESGALFHPDVIVVGAGLIGLACATALAREGVGILVISSSEPGSASAASAGILAPSVGRATASARALALASRDMYPAFVQALASRTGVSVALDRSGILEVALDDDEAASLRRGGDGNAEWIDERALRDLEPTLTGAVGALLHPGDGAVDSAALLSAVRLEAARDSRIAVHDARVTRVETGSTPIRVMLTTGEAVEAPAIVMAAGAWMGLIDGLPRSFPLEPVRGQMLALAKSDVRHVVMSSHGYLVPRGDRLLVGSTMEYVGFDARTTADGRESLLECAREISPSLGSGAVAAHWAGLRPVTPDLLPVVGEEPDCDGLFYAVGHSRNGVLLAPITARVIAELIAAGSTSIDISAYAPGRFGRRIR